MIAFFIDADNLSSSAWVNEACKSIEMSEGSIAIRRAYGSIDNLKGLSEVMRFWAIKSVVNLSLLKNTTDISLAVDATELACQTAGLKLVVIGSGDADFVPLVVRLREKGIRVFCVSEKSKMAQDAIPAYDQIIYVGVSSGMQSDKVATERAILSATASSGTPAKKVPTKISQTKTTAPSKATLAKKVAAKKVTAKKTTQGSEKITINQIVAAVPKLITGDWLRLGEVAKLLHDAKLLGKSATSTKLFKKYPHHFELKPDKQPSEVKFILPPH